MNAGEPNDFAAFVALSAARLFDAFAGESHGSEHPQFARMFELIGRSGAIPEAEMRTHDLLLRRGEAGFAHASRIVNPRLWRNEELRTAGLRPESTRPGLFAHVVDYSVGPRAADPDLARLVVETSGRVPHGQLILRPRVQAYAGKYVETDPAANISPPPITSPYEVIDERIDEAAQRALLRMNKGDAAARQDAAGMLAAVKGTLGEHMRLAGIYGDNLKKAAELASRHGTVRWELVPKGEDAALILEPGDPAGVLPPTIIFRGGDPGAKPVSHYGVRNLPERLDPALRKAWAAFLALRGGQLGVCPRPGDLPAAASIETVAPLQCNLLQVIFPPLPLDIPVPVPGPPSPQQIPPRTPLPPTPKGLNRVPHPHIRRTCPDGVSFINDKEITAMSPGSMNPGFLTAKDEVIFDKKLDAGLVKLILGNPKYSAMLAPESIKNRKPSQGDKLRVAIVDISLNKFCLPGFAGWGSAFQTTGGSTAKISMLFAAKQIIFDLSELARVGRINSKAQLEAEANATWFRLKCKPDFKWLTKVNENKKPVTVEESDELKDALKKMIRSPGFEGNTNASEVILRLGFEYIASVLWQSGLRNPTRGGLWIGNTFETPPIKAVPNKNCHQGNAPIVWKDNPFGATRITATALSVATYFTLLAQRRLVNKDNTEAMEKLLKGGCEFLPDLPGVKIRAAKCGLVEGVTNNVRHDAALLRGQKHHYVLVVLTTDPSWPDRDDFIREVDALVRANNP